jgi:sec-independent protein translocase protein TatA
MSPLFAGLFGTGLGLPEIIFLAILGVLFFGRRLPEVSKYLGKSIIEFKKGMKGLEDNLDDGPAYAGGHAGGHAAPTEAIRPPQRVVATAPKFEDSPASTHVTTNPPQV